MNLSVLRIRRPIMACAMFFSAVAAWAASGQALADQRQSVERCSALITQNKFKEGAACLQPYAADTAPDAQTAAAQLQLGQLYETGRGVPADPDHALRLYRSAEKMRAKAPDVADRAAKSATQLINKLRQAEEP